MLIALFCISAQKNECTELQELLGEGRKESPVAEEEFAYYARLYQLQAELKTAELERAMLENGSNFEQLRAVIVRINELRLQIDLAALNLQEQLYLTLPAEKYKQWKSSFELAGASDRWSGLIELLDCLSKRCNASSQADYLQRLPQASIQRACGAQFRDLTK